MITINYDNLNKMMNYIEENLTEEIDYNKLCRILGVSEYSLQRIFTFMCNISLSEYIRKRRLSKAFEEIKNTDSKIIDIAIKYQYDSAISFSRSFKNMFGITPSECRNTDLYKVYPMIKFENNNSLCDEINYEIKNINKLVLYCLEVRAKTDDDLLFKIRELYKKIKENGMYNKFNENGMYAVTGHNGKELYYYLGSKIKDSNLKQVVVPSGEYAKFTVNSRKQKDIFNLEKNIYNTWINSMDFNLKDHFEIELYEGDNCYLYFPIER